MRVKNSGCVRALNHWSDVCHQLRRLRRFAKRLKNRAVARAVTQWVETVDEIRQRKMMARRALQRVLNGVLVRTFLAWAAAARASAEEREEREGRDAEQAALERERLRKASARMAHRLESLVFEAWKKLTADSKSLRFRAFSRWRHAASAKAFDKWRDFSEEHSRMVRLGRQLFGRYLNGLLARMFAAWADHAQGSRSRKAYVETKTLAMLTGRGERDTRARRDTLGLNPPLPSLSASHVCILPAAIPGSCHATLSRDDACIRIYWVERHLRSTKAARSRACSKVPRSVPQPAHCHVLLAVGGTCLALCRRSKAPAALARRVYIW